MHDPAAYARRYLEVWNEADDDRRRALIEGTFTPDAGYLDPLMKGAGHGGIDAMIAAARGQFPGHRFTLEGTPDGHNDRVRFSWVLAPEGGTPVARGTDVCVVAPDGRFAAVTGFLDPVAA